jgi:hypothetical protein
MDRLIESVYAGSVHPLDMFRQAGILVDRATCRFCKRRIYKPATFYKPGWLHLCANGVLWRGCRAATWTEAKGHDESIPKGWVAKPSHGSEIGPESPAPVIKHIPALEGKLILPIVSQDEYWINVRGEVLPLAAMDKDYLGNLVPFLRRHGEKLRWSWLLEESKRHGAMARPVIGTLDGEDILANYEVPLFSDNGGNLDHAFDQWVDHEMDRPFDEWLEDRPLVKKIRELLAA